MTQATQQTGPVLPVPPEIVGRPHRPFARGGRLGALTWVSLAIAALFALPVISVLTNLALPSLSGVTPCPLCHPRPDEPTRRPI